MVTRSREIHGIPEETLRKYLTGLGGTDQPGGIITGQGWAARITQLPDYPIGKALFCSFQVEIEGEVDAVEKIMRQFDLRIMRPGG